MNLDFDYLIVGQGAAGTLMHYQLSKRGKSCLVIDNQHIGAASKVAAGIINPVTGRRYVKSWRIEELMPFALATYRAMEQDLGIDFCHERNILRSLFNHGEENDWLARTAQEDYQPYLKEEAELGNLNEVAHPVFSIGEVNGSLQVDLSKLIAIYKERLLEKKQLHKAVFDYGAIKFHEKHVEYNGQSFHKVIFCEGKNGVNNPYFNHLPYQPAKGEVLIARIPKANLEKMYKHRIFVVPKENDLYWIGSMYEWNYDTEAATPESRSFLEQRLKEAIKVPFEIVEHLAAVRPTVKDRRPFLGLHPEHEQLVVFNGLGTKGASLGPFFSAQLAEYLVNDIAFEHEVNIKRFDKNEA